MPPGHHDACNGRWAWRWHLRWVPSTLRWREGRQTWGAVGSMVVAMMVNVGLDRPEVREDLLEAPQRHTKGAALLLGSGVPPRRSPLRRRTHRPPRRQEHLAQAVQVERGHVQV